MPAHIERTDYKGWPNCWPIANSEIELIVTADVGPRVIRFGFNRGQNLFKNFDDQMGKSSEPVFMARGGSRIWIGPEDRIATYAPDNFPVQVHLQRRYLNRHRSSRGAGGCTETNDDPPGAKWNGSGNLPPHS